MTAPMPASPAEAARWPQHVDKLRAHVLQWSGNPLQVVDLSFAEWVDRRQNTALTADIERDAVDLVGTSIFGELSASEADAEARHGQSLTDSTVWKTGRGRAPGHVWGAYRSRYHGPRRTVS